MGTVSENVAARGGSRPVLRAAILALAVAATNACGDGTGPRIREEIFTLMRVNDGALPVTLMEHDIRVSSGRLVLRSDSTFDFRVEYDRLTDPQPVVFAHGGRYLEQGGAGVFVVAPSLGTGLSSFRRVGAVVLLPWPCACGGGGTSAPPAELRFERS